MKYTKEVKNFIENLLNKCITYYENNVIYYINNKNIIRLVKINKLLNIENGLKIDLTKLSYLEDIILIQDLNEKQFKINFEEVWLKFINFRYFLTIDSIYTNRILNEILCDILNVKKYKTDVNFNSLTEYIYSK